MLQHTTVARRARTCAGCARQVKTLIQGITTACERPTEKIDRTWLRKQAHQLADFCKSGAWQGGSAFMHVQPARSGMHPPTTSWRILSTRPLNKHGCGCRRGLCRVLTALPRIATPSFLLFVYCCYCCCCCSTLCTDELVECIVAQGAVQAVVPLLTIGEKDDPAVAAG